MEPSVKYKRGKTNIRILFLPLIGRHQVENCATAIGALEVLSETGVVNTDNEMVINALARVKCPARIEVVSEKPLVVLDTAHTVPR